MLVAKVDGFATTFMPNYAGMGTRVVWLSILGVVVLALAWVWSNRHDPDGVDESGSSQVASMAPETAGHEHVDSSGGSAEIPASSEVGDRSVRLDAARPFVDQLAALEAAADTGDAGAAMALASGWDRCRHHWRMSERMLTGIASVGGSAQMQLAETLLAQVSDDEVRETGIAALAEVDPDELVREGEHRLRRRTDFCATTERMPRSERHGRALDGILRAIELGDQYAARAFTVAALKPFPESTAADAIRFAERKHQVRDVVNAGLSDGDPYMLGEMALFVADGYFSAPDPVLAYSYSQAYLELVRPEHVDAWSDGDFHLRPYMVVARLDAALEEALTPVERQRAQAESRRLTRCCGSSAP